ncbi:prolactin-releasing peptide [Triplophysa dalaica]|uniref:prolactin-releasing peptide n=1 Tax=Triplophysa dalaica TaxID=1582913 RepID=UPI0024DFB57C|nr:prolactin-releasing peptide [Triplophysa dalaica]
MAVKPCALLCILMLLVYLTQPKPDDLPLHSTDIRDPKIDAQWYKGRGIRPVWRFGRRMLQRGERSYLGKHRYCYPEVMAMD